jgi:subtilisin family serine protease
MQRTDLFSGSIGARGSGALRFALLIAALTICACALPAFASADDRDDGPDFSQYLTIKFVDGTNARERNAIRRSIDASYETSLASPLLQQASLRDGMSPEEAAEEIADEPAVEFAVASGEYTADELPNDAFLDKQWALNNYGQVFMSRFVNGEFENVSGTAGADMNATEAWDLIDPQTLSSETLGVIDTGVAYEHPDLAANMVPGKDFYDADNDPRDINGHGTHVASVAAGVTDNEIGTAGVNPWGKVMPLRAADEYGSFSWAAIEQAVSHGLANGVRVFNGSFGGPDNDPAFVDLMENNPQALFVFSAGNGGSDQVGDNHDAVSGLGHRYPCDTNLPNVLCVGASNWNDAMSGFSDYGVTSVDLLAPGASVYAAKPCRVPAPSPTQVTECPYDEVDETAPIGLGGGPYAFQLLSGTSMAAPAVAATASLLWQKCPTLKSSQVLSAIVGTVDEIASVQTKVAYGGRLNVASAVGSLGECPPVSDGTDWPTPPEQPTPPGDDGGGSSGGTGTVIPPIVDNPPIGDTAAEPLTFQIVRPSRTKIGKASTVKFRLKCSDVCSASVVARPIASGVVFKAFKGRLARGKAGTRTVSIKVPRATLRAARAMLSARSKVRLKYTVIVTDKAGRSSKPVNFSVKLSK